MLGFCLRAAFQITKSRDSLSQVFYRVDYMNHTWEDFNRLQVKKKAFQ